jgi:DNA-binding NarL/FixJ family response regulator
MSQTQRQIDRESFLGGRAALVFVSASAADARALREAAGADRWLVVNVPDLIGARAVIEKLGPALVLCDTEIEGQGSWRDLLEMRVAGPAFEWAVVSSHVDEALRAEVLGLGGMAVLEKPFLPGDFAQPGGLMPQLGRAARSSLLLSH